MSRLASALAVIAAIGMSGYIIVKGSDPVSAPVSAIAPLVEIDEEPNWLACPVAAARYALRSDPSVKLRFEAAPKRLSFNPDLTRGFVVGESARVAYRLETSRHTHRFIALEARTSNAWPHLFPVTAQGAVRPLDPAAMIQIGLFDANYEAMRAPIELEAAAPRHIFAPALANYLPRPQKASDDPIAVQMFDFDYCTDLPMPPPRRAYETENDDPDRPAL
jgi:hypothetical protein